MKGRYGLWTPCRKRKNEIIILSWFKVTLSLLEGLHGAEAVSDWEGQLMKVMQRQGEKK
ncbi:hypothetical protein YC2023_016809 [Brassica napus]